MKKRIKKLKLSTISYKLSTARGFVVLFTVLISSLVLAMALGISMIAYKEQILTSSAKEANIAFFAADTGLECALYQDGKRVFADPPAVPLNFNCADQTITFNPFSLELNDDTNCVKVRVNKNHPTPSGIRTRIESRGYNLSCSKVDSIPPNPRLIERLLTATY